MTTILIVDDDLGTRIFLEAMLQQEGYQVVLAADGQEALASLGKERCDLVLMDIQMPVMDGYQATRRIKAQEQDGRLVPVIFLTSVQTDRELALCLECGGDDFMNKPPGPVILKARIHAWLRRAELANRLVQNRQWGGVEGLIEGAGSLIKPSSEDVLLSGTKHAMDDLRQKSELHLLIGQYAKTINLMRRAEFCFHTLQEATDLALILAEASPDPGRTVNGYSELLINAVEHGNLGISYAEKSQLLTEGRWKDELSSRLQRFPYADRLVTVVLEKTTSALVVTITDQGEGFDWEKYIVFCPERAFDLHGRGVAMSAMCFDSLEYRGNGNIVVTSMRC